MKNQLLIACSLLSLIALSLSSYCLADEQSFTYPTAKDYPTIRREAQHVTDFVPKGWTILGNASGDLNGDKISDQALVIRGNIAKFKQKNIGLGTNDYDTNPRLLLVLLKNSDGAGYRLADQTKNIVAGADSPTMDEPFEKIAIKNNVLEIFVQSFYNAGSWSASSTVYKFRRGNGSFVLIGAEHDEVQRNTGEESNYSYNFLTGKVRIARKTIESNLAKRVSWKRIPKRPFRKFSDFAKLYEWEVVPTCYL
ncbi:MAG: hypothetical protein JST89_00415 [Cyanobacteria bacterium SZAS-4]|nr:hypothetical protein [Cyanobacteria bacterium SZAS-4]